ncbi:MAG TPA: nitrile hydratase subunit beta [Chloroflexota bacterium]|jgi:nitrile hydratase
MNGVHDMGGMHGFGPIQPRQNEETFHADWERRIPGLTSAARGAGINLDQFRYAIERMPPAQYLSVSYYERHLFSAELNLIEQGVLTPEEIEQRLDLLRRDPAAGTRRDEPAVTSSIIEARLASELPPAIDTASARFKPGDAVVVRNVHPSGHTRMPRYVRGKRGTIDRLYGLEPLPDASAAGRGSVPEPLYSVRFEAEVLWGKSADGRGSVNVDLWESYLEQPREDAS